MVLTPEQLNSIQHSIINSRGARDIEFHNDEEIRAFRSQRDSDLNTQHRQEEDKFKLATSRPRVNFPF